MLGFWHSLRAIEVAARPMSRGYERSTDSAANTNWAGSLERIELLKGLKKAFDPKNILNPLKILDL